MVAIVETLFWISLGIVVFTYAGYGVIVWFLVKIREYRQSQRNGVHPCLNQLETDEEWPEVTLVVPAYNERDFIMEKVHNSLALDYPERRLKYIFITDGSTDGTPELLKPFEDKITILHKPEREGKIMAMHRAMGYVKTPIVVFTDANTTLNRHAIKLIVRHYRNPEVGCVAGEKRIRRLNSDNACGAGEGLYWQYESWLKKLDSRLYSTAGAAGELFSIRTALYKPVPHDTVLDDFMLSLKVVEQGYRIAYEPEAYAIESPSESAGEELKRKVRISAGGVQAIFRLAHLLNPFRYGIFSFQLLIHRFFRWSLAPLSLVVLLLTNPMLSLIQGGIYQVMWFGQLSFYMLAITGWILQHRKLKVKIFFIPFYFLMMNYAVLAGIIRFFSGRQTVQWERAKRAMN